MCRNWPVDGSRIRSSRPPSSSALTINNLSSGALQNKLHLGVARVWEYLKKKKTPTRKKKKGLHRLLMNYECRGCSWIRGNVDVVRT